MGKNTKAVAVRSFAYFAAALWMFIVGVNVAMLYPNPNYEASWVKVAAGVAFFVFFLIVAHTGGKAVGDRHG